MIIGVAGRNASGKDTVATFLQEKGFKTISLSDEIRRVLMHEGRMITRDNLVEKGNDLREKHGEGVLAKRVKQVMREEEDYAITSIRNPGEVNELAEDDNFYLLWLKTPAKKRWQLMKESDKNRNDSIESWEEFKKVDEREWNNEDSSKQNLKKVMEMSDYTIENDKGLEDLKEKVDKVVNEIQNSS